MPMMKVERRSGTWTPAALANETKNIGQLNPGERIIGFGCRVRRAADGLTATLSFGRTGVVTDFMLAAEAAVRVAGRKLGNAATGLNGNGTVPGQTQIVADFVVGDATVAPIVSWCALVCKDEHYQDMLQPSIG